MREGRKIGRREAQLGGRREGREGMGNMKGRKFRWRKVRMNGRKIRREEERKKDGMKEGKKTGGKERSPDTRNNKRKVGRRMEVGDIWKREKLMKQE